LKVFKTGAVSDYKGTREEEGLVSYMMKQAEPPFKDISSAAELEALKAKGHYFNLGVFTSDSPLKAEFIETANRLRDDYVFAMTNDPAVAGGEYSLLSPRT